MKKIVLTLAVMFAFVGVSQAQLAFSVSSGFGINSSYLGYKKGKFMPFFSFQALNGSWVSSSIEHEYDPSRQQVVEVEEEYKVAGTLYVPGLGMRTM